MIDTARLAASFGQAQAYDRHAAAQHQVARALAERLAALPLPPRPRVLEVGCGTGFLGEALLPRWPQGVWTMTDLAPAMLERARARLAGRAAITYRVMDGEHPDVAGPFDLICSSLAAQWFEDLAAGVDRLAGLLAPRGWLGFSTLVEGSFAAWRAAHGDLPCGVPDYPSAAALRAMGCSVELIEVPVEGGAVAFLRHLRGIGARLPRAGYRPLTQAQLHAVMRRFDAAGVPATYRVALCVMQRA
jgi:malonyl-CoA O-methyltransferase